MYLSNVALNKGFLKGEKSFLLLLCCFLIGCKASQPLKPMNLPNDQKMYPYYEEGAWGLNDAAGNHLTKPIFEEAHISKFGMSLVKKDNKYGYVNSKGKYSIKPKYVKATDFVPYFSTHNPIAKVQLKGVDYFINPAGKKVTLYNKKRDPFKVYENNTSQVTDTLDFVIKSNDKYRLNYHYLSKSSKDLDSLIHDTTSIAFDTVYLLQGRVICKQNNKYGFLTRSQLKGVPLNTNPFKKHYHEKGVFKPMVECVYDTIEYPDCRSKQPNYGYLKARLSDKWGIITLSGKPVTSFDFYSIKRIDFPGKALVEYEADKFGYISIQHEGTDRNPAYSIVEHFKR